MNTDLVYLATGYDPEKRRVVSYGLSSKRTKEFATSVVVKALRANGKPKMIHSDMGSQYTSSLFEGTLQNAGIEHPYDNTRIESFHSLTKRELIYHEEHRTIDDVRASVEWYVNWYNNERINSRIEKPTNFCLQLRLEQNVYIVLYDSSAQTVPPCTFRQCT
jgi:Transposase and inactivated derivatives